MGMHYNMRQLGVLPFLASFDSSEGETGIRFGIASTNLTILGGCQVTRKIKQLLVMKSQKNMYAGPSRVS